MSSSCSLRGEDVREKGQYTLFSPLENNLKSGSSAAQPRVRGTHLLIIEDNFMSVCEGVLLESHQYWGRVRGDGRHAFHSFNIVPSWFLDVLRQDVGTH